MRRVCFSLAGVGADGIRPFLPQDISVLDIQDSTTEGNSYLYDSGGLHIVLIDT